MTTTPHQPALHPVTSNALLCDPPETFVRDDHVSWMPFDGRYHRSDPSNFPRIEMIPHPTDDRLLIEVWVTYVPAAAKLLPPVLEATACGVRLRDSYRAMRLCGLSVVTTLAVELAAEKRALLNQ